MMADATDTLGISVVCFWCLSGRWVRFSRFVVVFGCVCWGVVFIVEGVKGFYGFGGWVLMVRWGLLVVGVVVLAAGCVGDGSSGVPAVTSVLPSESSATASTAAAGGLGGSEVVGGSSTTLGVVGVEEVQVDDSSFGEPGGLVVEDGSD